MQGVKKVYVAYGYSEDMTSALGVSPSWLSNAANNGGKVKGLHVYGYETNVSLELTEDELAELAVGSISEMARKRLRALIKESDV